jgi:hypothetical protein
MTWQTDDGRHEAWIAATFADGALGGGQDADGVIVTTVGGQELAYEQWQRRPDSEVTGWLILCGCGGWRGRPWFRVADPGEQDLAARRAHSPDCDPPGEVEDACHAEWTREHLWGDLVDELTQLDEIDRWEVLVFLAGYSPEGVRAGIDAARRRRALKGGGGH